MKKFAPFNLTKKELIKFTSVWKGERFDDGRPKVPDDILNRMKKVTLTEAWIVLRDEGYHHQFEGNWISTQPNKVLVGRAVTAVYMPRRDDLRSIIFNNAHNAGCVGDQPSWPIDILVKNDVYVADVFGKKMEGAMIGDNLSTSIYSKTGTGVVHNGPLRDLEGIKKLDEFVAFFRGYHPASGTHTTMLIGINTPVRIGNTTVMPGDVVLGKSHGIVFIPPHLAQKVVTTSEIVSLRDIFGKLCLKEGKYKPGEIDGPWTKRIENEFLQWLKENMDELNVPKDTIIDYLNSLKQNNN